MSDFKLHRLLAVPAGVAVIALALAFASPALAAEFDDQCAMGLASGQNVKTDCSVNWTDEDGHVYCFSSDASKEAFLKDPAGNIKKAKEFLASKQAAKAAGTKEFTEEDVNKRVEEVVGERSKDGAFVFHDPKLDADLNLVFEQVKGVRGMEGYGWFANAIFQWVPDHVRHLHRLLEALPTGGVLAVQMPDNLDEPSHAMMREVAHDGPWRKELGDAARIRDPLPKPGGYYDALGPLSERIEIWHTIYNHVLDSPEAIVEWVKGTGLKPFVDPLEPAERKEFIREYTARVAAAYPAQFDGKVILRFPRFFVVAVK